MIAYIIKSSLSLILMFGLYWVFLRKEKLFRFNRFFLIFSILISLVIPFISVPVNIQNNEVQKNIVTVLNYDIPAAAKVIAPIPDQNSGIENTIQPIAVKITPAVVKSPGISFTQMLIILYFSGVVLLLFRFLRNIIFISHQKRLSENIHYSGQRLVLVDSQVNPYCFLNAIYVSKQDYLENRIDNELLNHEVQHIKQAHTIDIIFMELIQIFYWFNPIIILYNNAARVNHEYLADNSVLSNSNDVKSYADILLNFISCRRNIPLTSGFNQSLTRKRLIMMTKTKSRNYLYGLRILTTLILVLVSFFILSIVPSNSQPIIPKLLNSFQTPTVSDIDGNIYQTVKIGNQIWMAENLKTTRYNDGTTIPLVTDSIKWKDYSSAFCWYENDEKNYKDKYGALYNWYSVNANKLCPLGWHVPTSDEIYYSLQDNLMKNGFGYGKDGKDVGKSLASTSGWKSDSIPGRIGTDQSGNNSSGFNAFPVGYRGQSGTFGSTIETANFWTSSDNNTYIGNSWFLASYNSRLSPWWGSKRTGLSVRCVMDNSDGKKNTLDKESLNNNVDQVASDFSGVWHIKKGMAFEGLIPSTLIIEQQSDVITLTGTFDFLDKKPINNKQIYSLNGKETISRSGEVTEKVSVNWGRKKDEFIITTIRLSENKGTIIETKCTDTYMINREGNSIEIYFSDNINPQWVIYEKEVPENILPPENIHGSAPDFSGKWKFNNEKSTFFVFKGVNFSRIITISQKGDTVTFNITNNFPEGKPMKSKITYTLDGKGTISKSGDKVETVSAAWSLYRQSFSITTTLNYTKNATQYESKRVETYTLADGGNTLVVNYIDTPRPEGSLTSVDEGKYNMVYDKEVTETLLGAKYSPNVIAVFADKSQGSVPKNVAIKAYSLEIKILNSDSDEEYEITGFTLLYTKDNVDTELIAKGKELTDEMKSYIANMQWGQKAIFKDIKAAGSDGKIKELAPLVIQIE